MARTYDERTFEVRYTLDDREIEALEELLPYWQQYENEGERPFENWTIENVFQAIMQLGSKHDIARRIQEEQYRQGIIEHSQMLKPGEGFKTMKERQNGD